MTPSYDPIPELEKLGYTEREAAFLYLVGMHSGYFIRSQYLAFIAREDGAMVQRFLKKAIELQHVQAIEYASGRHIYHLKSKLVYRILGQEDSQNRRVKGDRQIRARLMQVDYLLEHFGDQFLETAQQKIALFHQKLKVPLESLPRATCQSNGEPAYFPDRFPVSVKQEANQLVPLTKFVFIDDGMRSISAFVLWLEHHTRLLKALRRTELVYVGGSSRNFDQAKREFLRRFPPNSARRETPRGIEHFLAYLDIRTRYDRSEGGLTLNDLRLLREGSELYTSPEHQAWFFAWKNRSTTEAKIRSRFEPKATQISFSTYLLDHDYPIWSMKYRRSVP